MPNSDESCHSSNKVTMHQTPVKAWTGQPYPAYKDSGVEWLGEVPEHWSVGSVKSGYDIKLGKMLQTQPISADDIEIPYLKARDVQWFSINLTSTVKMWASPRDIEQFSVSNGDLLVCEGGEGGRCGILTDQVNSHIIQNSLHRVRPRYGNSNVFLQYTMRAVAEMGWFVAINNKATIAHFTHEKFGALRIPFPHLPEQRAIARFLDDANQRIQRYIEAKEKLVKLLEEQKQVIIQQAVTGQVDVRTDQPYPAYKDSGVEWLGEVPEHWEVRRMKTLSQIRYGLSQPPREVEDGLPLIRATNIWRGKIVETDMIYVDQDDVPDGRNAFLSEREIIVVRTGAYTADSAIIPKAYGGAVAGYDMVVAITRALPEFIAFCLLANYIRNDQLIVTSTRSAQPHLNAHELGNASIFLPPLPEQRAIACYLGDSNERISAALAAVKREIQLFHEYRTRLIADVVTGKLDVREAAAELFSEQDAPVADSCQDGANPAAPNQGCHP